MAKCFIEEVAEVGGRVFIDLRDPAVTRSLQLHGSKEQFQQLAELEVDRMKKMQAYVAVRGGENITESSDVPKDQMKLYLSEYQRKVFDQRINHTKWVVMRYPSLRWPSRRI